MKRININQINSPIILKGDSNKAFRDPTAIFTDNVFRLFYPLVLTEEDGQVFLYTAMSKSSDLINWTQPNILTPRDKSLNFSSPGNIIKNDCKWIMCLQTYPRPNGEKYANENARIWIMESEDLENWTLPKN